MTIGIGSSSLQRLTCSVQLGTQAGRAWVCRATARPCVFVLAFADVHGFQNNACTCRLAVGTLNSSSFFPACFEARSTVLLRQVCVLTLDLGGLALDSLCSFTVANSRAGPTSFRGAVRFRFPHLRHLKYLDCFVCGFQGISVGVFFFASLKSMCARFLPASWLELEQSRPPDRPAGACTVSRAWRCRRISFGSWQQDGAGFLVVSTTAQSCGVKLCRVLWSNLPDAGVDAGNVSRQPGQCLRRRCT